MIIPPHCAYCGVRLREQIYKDTPRPYEVDGSQYHSAARCRDELHAQLEEARRLASEPQVQIIDLATLLVKTPPHELERIRDDLRHNGTDDKIEYLALSILERALERRAS